ncbi:MAG TPA: TetR/AcrR family transcriptional regulator [Kribbellaceae bacterium]
MTFSPTDRARAAHLGPERRRPQVLDAALSIAATEGIAAVSIARVAERLGVTRPVVYACFADRVDLIRALVAREEQVILPGAFAAMAPRAAEAPADAFVAGFQALLATVAEHPDSWRFLFEGTPDPAVRELFGRGRMLIGIEFERLIRPTLEAWGTTGVRRKLPVLVELFLSACEGAVRTLLADGSAWTPDELGEFVGRAVYRALREA